MNAPIPSLRSGAAPGILHFPPDFAKARIAAQERLLWPCLAVRFLTKAWPQTKLNLFEQAVLDLAQAGARDAETIADRCCLSLDLVRFILEKLRRTGALAAAATPARAAEPLPTVQGVAFLDLIGGGLLPFLLQGKPRYQEAEADKGRWRLTESAQRETWRPLPQNPALLAHRPSGAEIVALLRQFSARPPAAPPGAAPLLTVAPHAELGVSLDDAPEQVRLTTVCVVQEGQFEPMLTNPFGYGFSRLLGFRYQELVRRDPQECRRLEDLSERAHVRQRSASSPDAAPQEPKPPDAEARSRLRAALDLERRALRNGGAEAEKDARIALSECWGKLYAAMEWALSQMLDAHPPQELCARLLTGQDRERNARMLAALALRCGFRVRQEETALLGIHGDRIAGARRKAQPEFAPLLALGLAGIDAAEGHPLRSLAAQDPDWLMRMTRLKRLRDQAEHGVLAEDREFREVEAFGRQMRRAAARLLPGMEPLVEGEEAQGDDLRAVENERLRARNAVMKRLGYLGFTDAPNDLREQLIALETETFVAPDAPDRAFDASAPVSRMAGAMQEILRRIPSDASLAAPAGTGADLKTEALARARALGFADAGPEGTPSLRTVARGRLENALAGRPSSLGADFLALLLRADEKTLRRISAQAPDLPLFIDRLCVLRGHGNDSVPLLPSEIGKLAGNFHDVFRTLMEI